MSSHDKINITIRPVGNGGFGIPVYVDMGRGNGENSSGHYLKDDPILGIILGTVLSILCIFVFLWIILRKRGCSKQRRNQINQNRPITQNFLQQQQPHQQLILCNTDLHEMQTLITKTELPSIIPNGVDKHTTTVDAIENIYSQIDDDDDEKEDLNKSLPEVVDDSSPKIQKIIEPEIVVVPVVAAAVVNGTKQNGIKNHYANLNGAAIINQNGSTIKSPPPPQKHSISKSPLKTNGNLRITENPQYLIEPKQNSLLFDDSQEKLIDTSIDSIISHIDERSQCDDDDDDDVKNMEFNESNLSTKPLHSSINYMRPIVGPNG